MATFIKGQGQGYKGVQCYIAQHYPQKGKSPKTGKDLTGENIAVGVNNDYLEKTEGLTPMADPMLYYGHFTKDGVERATYSVPYSAKQWEAIQKVATRTPYTDPRTGEQKEVLSFKCDLMPAKGRDGLALNTKTLEPGVPMDKINHDKVTKEAQEAKRALRAERAKEFEAQVPQAQEATSVADVDLEA